MDLGNIVEIMDRCLELKHKIIQTSIEYHNILTEIQHTARRALSNMTPQHRQVSQNSALFSHTLVVEVHILVLVVYIHDEFQYFV